MRSLPILLASLLVALPSFAQPDEVDETDEAGAAVEVEGEATDEQVEAAAEGEAPREELEALEADPDEAREATPRAATATPDWVDVGGYLEPGFGITYRAEALPRDEITVGFFGRAGLIVEAKPFEMWHGRLELVFESSVLEALTDVELVDTDGDGTSDRTRLTRSQIPGSIVQEATVAFVPTPWFFVKGGAIRIPFTLQQQSANTALMFPTRSAANEIFLSGADFGVMASGDFADGIVLASAGVFGGESLGLDVANATARGVVISLRADVNPFGAFPFGEGDPARGPFRLGFGGGLLVRPTTIFDANTGTEPRELVDLRFAASLRMAVRGLYVAAEYFRRQQTDDFSFRPEIADGAYGQVAWNIPIVPSFALEPAARLGFVAQDQTFDPRLVGYLEAGVNLYPVADVGQGDGVRITLQYLGERRFTEEEEAHGARAAVRLTF